MSNNVIFEHKFILFVEDHYNPLGLVRSIGEYGIKPYVILVSEHPCLVNKSKYPQAVVVFTTIEDGYKYLLQHYSQEKYTPFLYTGSDDIVSFLDLHYEEIKNKFHFFNGGERGRLTKLMSKVEQMKLVEDCDIDIPKSELLPVGVLPSNLKYPVFTKADDSIISGWKSNVNICNSPEELSDAYKDMNVKKILVQEFVEKSNELCLDGLSINGGEEVYIPLQSLYHRFLKDSYGFYFYFEKFAYPELLKKIKDLFQKTKYSGIFTIEFLVTKDGCLKFLEINFRHSAWCYAATRCGINFPIIYAKSVLAKRLDSSDAKEGNYPFSAMVEFADFKRSVLQKVVSLPQWLKDLKCTDCFFYWNEKDNKPFWSYLLHLLNLK